MITLLILDVPFANGHFAKSNFSLNKLQPENIHYDQGLFSFFFYKIVSQHLRDLIMQQL